MATTSEAKEYFAMLNKENEIERMDKDRINSFAKSTSGKILDLGITKINSQINSRNYKVSPNIDQLDRSLYVPAGMNNVLPATTTQLAKLYKIELDELEESLYKYENTKSTKGTPMVISNNEKQLYFYLADSYSPSSFSWIFDRSVEDVIKTINPRKSPEEIKALVDKEESKKEENENILSLMIQIDNRNKTLRHKDIKEFYYGDSLKIPFHGLCQDNLQMYIPYIFNMLYYLGNMNISKFNFMPATISDFAVHYNLDRDILFNMLDKYATGLLSKVLEDNNLTLDPKDDVIKVFGSCYHVYDKVKDIQGYESRKGLPTFFKEILYDMYRTKIPNMYIAKILHVNSPNISTWKATFEKDEKKRIKKEARLKREQEKLKKELKKPEVTVTDTVTPMVESSFIEDVSKELASYTPSEVIVNDIAKPVESVKELDKPIEVTSIKAVDEEEISESETSINEETKKETISETKTEEVKVAMFTDTVPVYVNIKELLDKISELMSANVALTEENSKLKLQNEDLTAKCESRLEVIKQLTKMLEDKV